MPYGLYDSSKISGPVTMRLGAEGEKYPGIRKDDVNVGGRITVADDIGPFGNPTSDSARTMVTPSATELLIIVYAPIEIWQVTARSRGGCDRGTDRVDRRRLAVASR